MAFKFSLTTFKKVGGMRFRSRPTIAVWDIENTQVPSVPSGFKVADIVNNIRTNLQTAGFGCRVPLLAYCHFPDVKEEIRDSLKEQGLNVQNVPFKMADFYIASLVKEWVRENPDGGNVVLLSGDMELAHDCNGGPLFDMYISARTANLKKEYFKKVKTLGIWRWPDMLRSGAMLVPPKVIEKENDELHRKKKRKLQNKKK